MVPDIDLGALDDALAGFDDREPGIALGVAVHGELVWTAARGRASTASDAHELTATTTFYVASLAKQFTAACIADLARTGPLEVESEIRTYLPELPAAFAGIRVADLVHHISGIPSLEDEARSRGWPDRWWDGLGTDDMVGRIARAGDPSTPPRTAYRYANEGYVLLAAIIERVTGTSVDRWSARQLFGPLGMQATWFRDRPGAPGPDAVGHASSTGTLEPERCSFHFVGDGGLVTTLEDLATWSGVLDRPFRLGRELAVVLTTPGRLGDGRGLHYAWGLSVRPHRGRQIRSHGGQFVGYLAKFVQVVGDPSVTFLALANRDDLDLDGIVRDAVDRSMHRHLDRSQPDWRQTLRSDGLAWIPSTATTEDRDDGVDHRG